MSKTAIRYLVLNLGILTFASLVFIFMLLGVNSKGEELTHYVEIRREQESKQESALLVRRLITETESDRANLRAAFFASESDSIQFLTETERAATAAGLKISTEGLAPKNIQIAGHDMSVVEVAFAVAGRSSQVKDFIQYLETLPIHSRVETLNLKQSGTDDNWSAQVTILVSVLNQN